VSSRDAEMNPHRSDVLDYSQAEPRPFAALDEFSRSIRILPTRIVEFDRGLQFYISYRSTWRDSKRGIEFLLSAVSTVPRKC